MSEVKITKEMEEMIESADRLNKVLKKIAEMTDEKEMDYLALGIFLGINNCENLLSRVAMVDFVKLRVDRVQDLIAKYIKALEDEIEELDKKETENE